MIYISDRAGGRDNNFNLLRMIAATSVLVSHAYPLTLGAGYPEPLAWLQQDHIHDNLGRAAVFAFFGISGFFITRSFCNTSSLVRFCRARILRLFPALIAMTVLTAAFLGLIVSTAPASEFLGALPSYFYVNLTLSLPNLFGLTNLPGSVLPGVFESNPIVAINGSLWTLPFEVLCYALVLAGGLLGFLTRPRIFALGLLALLAAYFTLFHFKPGRSFVPEILLYLAVPFGIGSALWVWRDRVPLSPLLALALAVLPVFATGTILFRPLFCLALIYALFVIGYARLPLVGQYNRVGDYSYGMYIYAFPVQQMVVSWGVDDPLVNMALSLPTTLILAVLSWHLVEKPAMGYVSRHPRAALTPAR